MFNRKKIKYLRDLISLKNAELKKWERLAQLISSVEFECDAIMVPDRGIELIKHLQNKSEKK